MEDKDVVAGVAPLTVQADLEHPGNDTGGETAPTLDGDFASLEEATIASTGQTPVERYINPDTVKIIKKLMGEKRRKEQRRVQKELAVARRRAANKVSRRARRIERANRTRGTFRTQAA